jgi:transcription elongation factor Elf1
MLEGLMADDAGIQSRTARCERCGLSFDTAEADQEAWDKLDLFVCPQCASEALGSLGEEV